MRKYSNNRSNKIADQIQKDIADILRFKVKDPRINWITINEVIVSSDCSIAKIYWTTLDESAKDDIAKALDTACGFIRSELSKGFKTYTIPQLRFFYDDAISRGAKILEVLNSITHE